MNEERLNYVNWRLQSLLRCYDENDVRDLATDTHDLFVDFLVEVQELREEINKLKEKP